MLTREKKKDGQEWVIHDGDKTHTMNTRTGAMATEGGEKITQSKFDLLWNRAIDLSRQ
jgi:hypothetical protein